MKLVSAAVRPNSFPDYKALVCIFLYGGNDAFNTIVPINGTKRTDYVTSRGGLALDAASLLQLNPLAGGAPSDGATYGLHASMPEMRNLFNTDRKAAIIANVGPLLFPTTQTGIENGTVALPPQLFSHDDQSNFWQTSRPDDASANGWGGRIADLLYAGNVGQQIPMSLTMDGQNLFQRGAIVSPYDVSPYSDGVDVLEYPTWSDNQAGATAVNALLGGGQVNAFERGYAAKMSSAIANYTTVNNALNGAPALRAFPDTGLGRQLEKVAKMINIRSTLQMQRQIFFVTMGDFDTHSEQITRQASNLAELSAAVDTFYRCMVDLGLANNVTAFTASDFGRTLSVNSDGTDHGWGGHHFAVGGAVQGGKFYGTMPSLKKDNNPDDAGEGELIPTTSVDQYAAKLASWFGVDAGGIADIFPNLTRFPAGMVNFI